MIGKGEATCYGFSDMRTLVFIRHMQYSNPPFSVSIVACYCSTFSKFVYIASVWLMLLNERGHRSCPYLFSLNLPVSFKQRAQLKRKNDRKEGHLCRPPMRFPCLLHWALVNSLQNRFARYSNCEFRNFQLAVFTGHTYFALLN